MAKILAGQKIAGGYSWRVALNPLIKASLEAGAQPTDHWEELKIEAMRTVLRLKFFLHQDCQKVLLATLPRPLVEKSPRDAFWGVGPNGNGLNMLGKLLEQVREEIIANEEGLTATQLTRCEENRLTALLKRTIKQHQQHQQQGKTSEKKRKREEC